MKLLSILSLLATSAFSADLSGTWDGKVTMKTGEGETRTIPVALVLRHAGPKLEGTTQAGTDDSPLEISAGSVDGSKVYFEVKAQSDDTPVLIKVRLDHSGDRLTGTFTRESGGQSRSGELSFSKRP